MDEAPRQRDGRTRDQASYISITAEDDHFAQEWDDLADRMAGPPFLRPGFLLAWQQAFGEGPLQVAAVHRDGRLVAALPFNGSRRRKSYPANWHTPLAGVLCADADAARTLVEVIARHRTGRLSIGLVDEDDESTRGFVELLAAAGYRLIERPLTFSPYLAPAGDWADFEAAMNRKALRDIRRRSRRLSEQGAVAFDDETREPGSLQESFRDAVDVESSGWKQARGTSLSRSSTSAQFYRGVSQWAAKRGWLRITFLRLEGKPIAASIAIVADGVHYGLKLGYDPAFRQFMPGVLLMHEIVRDAFETGLQRVEMLGDDEAYKRIWCSSTRRRLGIQAFGPSIGGRVDYFAFASLRPLALRLGARELARAVFGNRDGPRL